MLLMNSHRSACGHARFRPPARGLPHLCAIHRHLYQDIFDWAGDIREVDIYQGDTRFCHFAYIEKEGNSLMQDPKKRAIWPVLRKASLLPV